ncbi:MAG: hypothetical protein Q7S98_03925 [Deltaproteobacteria bacterium]|nr:hypothetical protein [Deltaproteobacteria bacterium]
MAGNIFNVASAGDKTLVVQENEGGQSGILDEGEKFGLKVGDEIRFQPEEVNTFMKELGIAKVSVGTSLRTLSDYVDIIQTAIDEGDVGDDTNAIDHDLRTAMQLAQREKIDPDPAQIERIRQTGYSKIYRRNLERAAQEADRGGVRAMERCIANARRSAVLIDQQPPEEAIRIIEQDGYSKGYGVSLTKAREALQRGDLKVAEAAIDEALLNADRAKVAVDEVQVHDLLRQLYEKQVERAAVGGTLYVIDREEILDREMAEAVRYAEKAKIPANEIAEIKTRIYTAAYEKLLREARTYAQEGKRIDAEIRLGLAKWFALRLDPAKVDEVSRETQNLLPPRDAGQ